MPIAHLKLIELIFTSTSSETHFKDNPALSMLNDSDDDVDYS